jgi:glutaredoxin
MKFLLPKSLLVIFPLLFVSTSFAEVFQWTDSQGVVHFGGQPPVEETSESIVVDVVNASSADNNEPKIKQKEIVMYGVKWCGYCKKARDYFKQEGLKFTEYDVERRPSKMREFKRLGGTGYPLILIGEDEQMTGFSVSSFERIYNI